MTGEDLMMLADDISMQAGALDAIGDKAGRNAVDGGRIEQAMRHVSSLKMALARFDELLPEAISWVTSVEKHGLTTNGGE